MSLYQDNGEGENDYMSGGKNLESGESNYTMTALEVGTICGTIVAFILVMFFVFYCRRIDTRRKKMVGDGASSTGEGGTRGDHGVSCHADLERGSDVDCHPQSTDASISETGSTKLRSSGGDFGGGNGHTDDRIECTELKPISPNPLSSASHAMSMEVPQTSYSKTGSDRALTADRDLESCYADNRGWSPGAESGKKRLSGIVNKVGSWRAGKKRYSRTDDAADV